MKIFILNFTKMQFFHRRSQCFLQQNLHLHKQQELNGFRLSFGFPEEDCH